MKYCSRCAGPVAIEVPPGEDRPRHVCRRCGRIHYQNPRIVTGCLAEHEGRVLLCRRAIEPRHGLWTLPAGFMELGESVLEAALRETEEEARARVEVAGLYTLFNLPDIGQVYMMFRGALLDQEWGPGPESLEVALFAESEIPWGELAFSTIHHTLELYFEDRRRGHFPFRMGDILHRGGERPELRLWPGAPALIQPSPPPERK